MSCSKRETCTLFPVFSNAPFLKIWQIHYCDTDDHARCARFARLCDGMTVPSTLLPNGKHLPVVGPG